MRNTTGDKPLAGQAVVITGASRGIGEAAARRVAADGADVVINSSGANPEPLRAVADAINAGDGGRAVTSSGSVVDFAYTGALIDTCLERFGRIDGLINIAGIPSADAKTITDITPEHWNELIDIHLTGTFNTCRHAAPHLVAQGSGSIVNTTSAAFAGSFGGTGYPAGKGGTNSLTWAMAKDLAGAGVRCNAISPGARTQMSTGSEYENKIMDLNQRGLLSDADRDKALKVAGPELVAPMYAFLLSDAASHLTGQIYRVTGNYVALCPKPREEPLFDRDNDAGPWGHDELLVQFEAVERR